ncbi:hypothetical protein HK096_001918 [Nowakowskiella sp. JEL0078]|nr:hypothetical protein HK096_001918 [Nowakowskiella sp. JEL0078]
MVTDMGNNISDNEKNACLLLCEFSYFDTSCVPNNNVETFGQFKEVAEKAFLQEMYPKLIGSKPSKPSHFIIFNTAKSKISAIYLILGHTLFVCITGSNTLQDHVNNMILAACEIVPGNQILGECAAGFASEARRLSLAAVICGIVKNVDKVLLCGHSRGGSIAHLVHYDLDVNPAYGLSSEQKHKIWSLAFGSTPFLKPTQGSNVEVNSARFVTYFRPSDLVPALFRVVPELSKRLGKVAQQSLMMIVIELLRPGSADDAQEAIANIGETLPLVLSQFTYFGRWLRWDDKQAVDADPEAFFRTEEFKSEIGRIASVADVRVNHAINRYSAGIGNAKIQCSSEVTTDKFSLLVHIIINRSMLVTLSKSMLPIRLDTYVAAAIILKAFGCPSLANIVVEFFLEFNFLTERLIQMDQKSNTQKELSQLRISVLHAIKRINGVQIGVREFNGENVGNDMNSLHQMITATMGTKCRHENNNFILILGMVSYLTSLTLMFTLFGFFPPAGIGSVIGWFASVGIAGVLDFSMVFGGVALVNLANKKALQKRVIVQFSQAAYNDMDKIYIQQLQYMTGMEDGDELAMERDLMRKGAPRGNDSNELFLNYFECYCNVVSKLQLLHQHTSDLVLIAMRGQQGTGKTVLVNKINRKPLMQRESTNFPKFEKYTPSGAAKDNVYLVDVPGTNSARSDIVDITNEIFGIGNIGIYVIQFDVRPPDLAEIVNDIKMEFNGYAKILICLNKVVNVNPDLSRLREYVTVWKYAFETFGIDVEMDIGAHNGKRFTMVAVELHGNPMVSLMPPITQIVDAVVASGGVHLEDIIQWIEESVDEVRIKKCP